MSELTLLCRSATTFGKDGVGIDEHAYRAFLQRFVDTRLGIYVGSAGSGESHAMTRDELKKIYEIAVAVGKGKIAVNANPPEQHTAAMTLEHSLLAAKAGVDVVNIYGPSGWHGFKPTDDEIIAFYDEVFAGFKYPAALAPNPLIGYTPSPALVSKLCARYRQVVAINLAGLPASYFVHLKDALTRDIDIYVPYTTGLETLSLGAAGLLGAEANIIPKTFRLYLDCFEKKDFSGAAKAYAQIQRVTDCVKPWHGGSPRWIKMFFKAFKIPGGEGGLRAPYRMPDDSEIAVFVDNLLKLGEPEIDEQAAAAGLSRR